MEMTKSLHDKFERIAKKFSRKQSEKSRVMETTLDYEPSFKLTQCGSRIELYWPIRLPDNDPNGTLLGDGYQGGKRATDSKIGNAGVVYNVKGSKETHLHSALEKRLFVCFYMNPYVLNIRTQYEIRDEIHQMKCPTKTSQKKSRPLNVDFLLTLQVPDSSSIQYHCISGKPLAKQRLRKHQRRHLKEKRILAPWCTHEVMHKLSFSDIHYNNCWQLRQWMNNFDINEHQTKARTFATELNTSTASGTLARVLQLVGKRVGISKGLERQTFALAAFLGYLAVDPNHELRIGKELFLMKGLGHD